MKVLVILAVVGISAALPQGFLGDTPEVIAEKQRFFELYNAHAAAAAAAPDDNEISQASRPSFRSAHQPSVWRGPLASTIPAGVNNQVFQQQIRATVPQQFNTHSFSSPQRHAGSVPTQQKWTGPLAETIPAGLPGSVSQVRNTEEVNAAIADFTRAYNEAVRATQPVSSGFNTFKNTQRSSHFSQPRFSQNALPAPQQKWTGPFATNIPAGLPGSGPVADTPEVAAAKASFQRTFHHQLSNVFG